MLTTNMKHIFSLCSLFLVLGSLYANSPYISRVYEYCPAPGQFIHTMPAYEEGDNAVNMAQKAEDCLANNAQTMICLGAFGGYVTFGFDHPVVNKSGEYDLRILGNAFANNSEPGIVMVSVDANKNGLPDDTWYELAGSNYDSIGTIHHYAVTYYRPEADTDPVQWRDNQGNTGEVTRNNYHKQAYYPLWYEDSVTFVGTCLPARAYDSSGKGTMWIMPAFEWGYVDNQPNAQEILCSFNLDWAVDEHGKSVHLNSVDFIRVYTAVNQSCGWVGERSTEILNAIDLHQDETTALGDVYEPNEESKKNKLLRNGQLLILRDGHYYDILGRNMEKTIR